MHRLIDLFTKRWYFLLISIICAFSIASISINLASKPNREKEIKIFVGAFNKNNEELTTKLNEIKNPNIEKVSTYFYSPNDEYFNAYLSVEIKDCDLVILAEESISEVMVNSFFELSSLDSSLLAADNYIINENHYGLKLFDKNNKTGKLDFYFEGVSSLSNYYVFFDINSIHLSNDMYALDLINNL